MSSWGYKFMFELLPVILPEGSQAATVVSLAVLDVRSSHRDASSAGDSESCQFTRTAATASLSAV